MLLPLVLGLLPLALAQHLAMGDSTTLGHSSHSPSPPLRRPPSPPH